MNKKLVYLFAVLVLGLFVVSACEQAVGRRVNDNCPGGVCPRPGNDDGPVMIRSGDNNGKIGFLSIRWNCDDAPAGTYTDCDDEDSANLLIGRGCTIAKMDCAES